MRDQLIENALYEMALSAGDGSELSYLHTRIFREKMYHEHKNNPKEFENVHVKRTQSSTEYATLDHNKEEATHHSLIKHRKSGYRNIPFDHDEQISVNSMKGSNPGQSVRIMMHHLESSDVPIVSSEIQSDQGHKMWKSFAESALNKGHHVYYHDHNGLIQLNHDNLNHYHKKYFGDALKNEETNMVVSKKAIG